MARSGTQADVALLMAKAREKKKLNNEEYRNINETELKLAG